MQSHDFSHYLQDLLDPTQLAVQPCLVVQGLGQLWENFLRARSITPTRVPQRFVRPGTVR
jgi:hypothetical protein